MYRLVVKAGQDTLHHDPATESCNLDDSEIDERISDADADFLLATDRPPRVCIHCFPVERTEEPA